MTKKPIKWLMVANFAVGLTEAVWAQDVDAGKLLFQSSCATCHGIDGKGKGPLSEQLKGVPPDLTILAKKNGGVFPVSAMYEVIDGRKSIAAHGTREMPVWGYLRTFTIDKIEALGYYTDLTFNPKSSCEPVSSLSSTI